VWSASIIDYFLIGKASTDKNAIVELQRAAEEKKVQEEARYNPNSNPNPNPEVQEEARYKPQILQHKKDHLEAEVDLRVTESMKEGQP